MFSFERTTQHYSLLLQSQAAESNALVGEKARVQQPAIATQQVGDSRVLSTS
jgi:hypothetical protein